METGDLNNNMKSQNAHSTGQTHATNEDAKDAIVDAKDVNHYAKDAKQDV